MAVTGYCVRVYLYKAAKGKKEEGTAFLCKPSADDKRHVVDQSVPEAHFDDLDDLGDKIRGLLAAKGITWP